MRKYNQFISIYIFVFLIFCLFNCGKKKDEVDKLIEDGVEVVVNHIEPYKINSELGRLSLEEEFTIDTENDEMAELGLTDIWAANIDSEGNIYLWTVPISKGDLIFKFGQNGNFLTSFLRRGQGPGEIQSPTFPIITEQDKFIITDYFPRKIVILSLNGELVKEVSFKSRIETVYLLENGNHFIIESRQTPNGEYTESLMTLYNTELEVIKEFRRQKIPNERAAMRINGALKNGNFILWTISGGKIYVGDNDKEEYEILVYDYEGNLLKKIRKEYTPVEVSERFKEKILTPYERSSNEPIRAIGKKIYFPNYMPPYRCIFSDDEGRLFVMTYEKGKRAGEYIYDIFNAEGQFIGRLGLGNYGIWDGAIVNQFVIIAKNNCMYCIRQKESGYKELVVHRMRWE